MYKFIETGKAVANQGGAMEADTILKNGRNSKNQLSRKLYKLIEMKRFKVTFLAVITCAILSSCAPMSMPVYRTSSVKTVDISHNGVILKPVIAELSVNQTKVQGTAEGSSSQLQAIKNDAVRDALNKAGNADVIVEPNFTVTTQGTHTKVEVSGFSGTYKNFRSIEDSDNAWLEKLDELDESNKVKIYNANATNEQTAVAQNSNQKLGVKWGVLGGGILLFIILSLI